MNRRRSCHVIPSQGAMENVVAFERSALVTRKTEDCMYFVYVLRSALTDRLYIGSSGEPDSRLQSHNAGRGGWSKRYRPWVRIVLEEHPDRETAERREQYLKSGWGRRWLRETLRTEGWLSG